MTSLKNSEFAEYLLMLLFIKISRRAGETYAMKKLKGVFKELEPKYDFLKYVELKDNVYTEHFEFINVNSELNSVEESEFYKAVKDIIERTIKNIGKFADYYFLKEVRDSAEDIINMDMQNEGINLSYMQFQYLLDRKQEKLYEDPILSHKKTSTILSHKKTSTIHEYQALTQKTLVTLIEILSNKKSLEIAIATLHNILRELGETHEVLRFIEVNESKYKEGIEAIKITDEINSVEPYQLGKAIREVVRRTHEESGGKIDIFIEDFKNRMGEEYLLDFDNIGVNLHFIQLKYNL